MKRLESSSIRCLAARQSRTVGPVRLSGLLGLLLMAAFARFAVASDAATAFEQGRAMLAQADFDGAMKAYAEAVKADPKNVVYRQQYTLLRRVVSIREKLGEQTDHDRWETTVRSLRGYYYDNGIYGEALALDRLVHDKLKSPTSSAWLAETLLEMGQDAEADALLAGVKEEDQTLRTRMLLGIARARLGKQDEAKRLAAACPAPPDAGPGLLFDLARLQALTGDATRACELLTRCFEQTPPSRLAGVKAQASRCHDFDTLSRTDAFAKALATESKVAESKCSSGTDCGKCPMRASCGGGSSQQKTDGKQP